ncbi:MAG: rhodanese-like domain-containing protein [Candidatus Eiseniibacteriota bacterium]
MTQQGTERRVGKSYMDLVGEAKGRIREVTVGDVMRMQQERSDAVLVDIREESEWARGHMPGATALSRGVLEVKIDRVFPEKDTPLVLYCGGGNRSALAADVLQTMGYTNVVSMTGGFRGYVAAGGKVTVD